MENQVKKNNTKKLWIGIIVAVLLVAAVVTFVVIHNNAQQAPVQGAKAVTIQIVDADGNAVEQLLHTDAEYLRGALEEANLVKGTESEYGLFVTEVNGIAADDALQQWWCVTKGGEDVLTGVDTTPLADGDVYELTLKTGW